jgi:uncharacterized protein (TIRG00374 family)
MMAARETPSRPVAMSGVVNRRNLIAIGLSVSLVVCLATSFDPDLSQVWRRVQSGNSALFLLAFAAHYAGLVVRGYRWRLMLAAASPDGSAPTTAACSLYLLLCWFVNAVTWLRLGNVYRAYLVAKDGQGKFAPALGTVLAERFLDLLAVLAMLALAVLLLISAGDGRSVAPFLLATASAIGGVVVVLVTLYRPGGRLLARLPARLRDPFESFRQGVAAGLRPGGLLLTGGLTLLAWGFDAARLWLVVLALGLDVSIQMLLFVTFAQAMLLSFPLTPGGLGIVEPGLTGLLLLSFERPDALAITLLDRSVSYVSVVVVGAVAFGAREVMVSTSHSAAGRASPPQVKHEAETPLPR